jgi:hypothetical protein
MLFDWLSHRQSGLNRCVFYYTIPNGITEIIKEGGATNITLVSTTNINIAVSLRVVPFCPAGMFSRALSGVSHS